MHGNERYFRRLQFQGIPEYQPQIRGYKRRKLCNLTIEEKLEIFDDVIVKKDYHENIQARYNISGETVKTILKSMK